MRLCLNEAKLERLDPRTVDCCYHIHRRGASPALVSKHRGRWQAQGWCQEPDLTASPCVLLLVLARSKDTEMKFSEIQCSTRWPSIRLILTFTLTLDKNCAKSGATVTD